MSTRLRTLVYWGLVALQVVALIGLVATKERTLSAGTLVVIETRPVDPVDLTRGRFVQLGYEITAQDAPAGADTGDTAYIGLEEDADGVWRATRTETDRDMIPDDELFIAARVRGSSLSLPAIDSYFVDQDEAYRLERSMARGSLALVSLGRNGEPRLCDVQGSDTWPVDTPAPTTCSPL